VQQIRAAVRSHARIVKLPGRMLPGLSAALGLVLRDVLLTREEYLAMAYGLADTDGPATGDICLSRWLVEHGDRLGRKYANELRRHFT
jgi:NADH dehydrogenase